MRILLVGATGTIGTAVYEDLSSRHEVITAARNAADVTVDIKSPESIVKMYEAVGKVDAVICTAGGAHHGPLTEMTPENNELTIVSKLKGQINLVLLGLDYVNDNGSFTLITGVIMDEPVAGGASTAIANGGISAFVKSAACEMPRGIRINNVSPTLVDESLHKFGATFPGFVTVPVSKVAQAFRKSVEGIQTGQTFKVYG